MNELTKMGFTYDVTQLSPEGEIVSHQVVPNIMINEGITKLLEGIFIKSSDSYKYNNWPRYGFMFMENDYTPKPTDTFYNSSTMSLYGVDPSIWNEAAGSSSNTLYMRPLDGNAFSLVIGSNNLVSSREINYTFSKFKTITGCFIMMVVGTGSFSASSTWETLLQQSQMRLLSAALFYTPIQMVPGGTLKISAAFSLFSA